MKKTSLCRDTRTRHLSHGCPLLLPARHSCAHTHTYTLHTHTHTLTASFCLLFPSSFHPLSRPHQLRSQEAWSDFPASCPHRTRGDNRARMQPPWASPLTGGAITHLRFPQDLTMVKQVSQGSYDLILAPLAFAAWIPVETK